MGYDASADMESARTLSDLLSRRAQDNHSTLDDVAALIKGRDVAVLGDGPDAMKAVREMDGDRVLICADGAATASLATGRNPEIIVTDLDGPMADQVECSHRGTLMVVHAHGDNTSAIRFWVPKFHGKVLGTTQGPPLENVWDFGGFTDGDRATFLAHHHGAASIELWGFDFAEPGPNTHPGSVEKKRRKLRWALGLLALLEDPTPKRMQ